MGTNPWNCRSRDFPCKYSLVSISLEGLHTHRITRGDCDYRDTCWIAFARIEQGKGKSKKNQLFQQYEAVGLLCGERMGVYLDPRSSGQRTNRGAKSQPNPSACGNGLPGG